MSSPDNGMTSADVIEAYLDGALDEAQLESFELRLFEEPGLAREVDKHRLAREALREVLGESRYVAVAAAVDDDDGTSGADRVQEQDHPPPWMDRTLAVFTSLAWSSFATVGAAVGFVGLVVLPALKTPESAADRQLFSASQELMLHVPRGESGGSADRSSGSVVAGTPLSLLIDAGGARESTVTVKPADALSSRSPALEILALAAPDGMLRVFVPSLESGSYRVSLHSAGLPAREFHFRVVE